MPACTTVSPPTAYQVCFPEEDRANQKRGGDHPIDQKIADAKKAKEGSNLDDIKKATEALSNELQKIGQYMNQNSQNNEPKTETPPAQENPAPETK